MTKSFHRPNRPVRGPAAADSRRTGRRYRRPSAAGTVSWGGPGRRPRGQVARPRFRRLGGFHVPHGLRAQRLLGRGRGGEMVRQRRGRPRRLGRRRRGGPGEQLCRLLRGGEGLSRPYGAPEGRWSAFRAPGGPFRRAARARAGGSRSQGRDGAAGPRPRTSTACRDAVTTLMDSPPVPDTRMASRETTGWR